MSPDEASAFIPEIANLPLEDADFDTMAGLVLSQLDHIPGPQDQPEVALGPLLFRVEAMDGRRIAKLWVKVRAQSDDEDLADQPAMLADQPDISKESDSQKK